MIFRSRLWSFKEKLIIIVFDHDQLFVTLIMIKNHHDLEQDHVKIRDPNQRIALYLKISYYFKKVVSILKIYVAYEMRCKLCRLFYRSDLPEHSSVGNSYVFTTLMGPRCLKVIKVNFLNSKLLKKIVQGSCIYKINIEKLFLTIFIFWLLWLWEPLGSSKHMKLPKSVQGSYKINDFIYHVSLLFLK